MSFYASAAMGLPYTIQALLENADIMSDPKNLYNLNIQASSYHERTGYVYKL